MTDFEEIIFFFAICKTFETTFRFPWTSHKVFLYEHAAAEIKVMFGKLDDHTSGVGTTAKKQTFAHNIFMC